MPETTNLKLPLFDPNDKPSWLGSWNGAMNIVDQAVGRIDGEIADTDASIQAAQTAADAAKTAADAAQAATTALQGRVNQNETDIQSQAAMIETLQGDVSDFLPPDQIVIGKKYLIERGDYSGGRLTVDVGANVGYLCTIGREYRIGLVRIDGAPSSYFSQIGTSPNGPVRLIGFIKGNVLNFPNKVWAGSAAKVYIIRSTNSYSIGFTYDSTTNLTYLCYVGGSDTLYNDYIPFIVERRTILNADGYNISLSGNLVGQVLNITALKA